MRHYRGEKNNVYIVQEMWLLLTVQPEQPMPEVLFTSQN